MGEISENKLQIGSNYAGGIVFYINKTGKHGLVCSDKDLDKAPWGSWKYLNLDNEKASALLLDFDIYNCDFIKIANDIGNGVGLGYTKKIVEMASSSGLFGLNKIQTAARICFELNLNGYQDWYLPTIGELILMKQNLFHHCKFSDEYWSCTEANKGKALYFPTNSGTTTMNIFSKASYNKPEPIINIKEDRYGHFTLSPTFLCHITGKSEFINVRAVRAF